MFVCLLVSCTPSRDKQIEKISSMEKEAESGDTLKYKELLKAYEIFIRDFPKDSLSPEYLFTEVNIYRIMKRGDSALKAIETLTNSYPGSNRIPECYFLKALVYEEIFYDQEKAKRAYLNFIDRYPSHNLVKDAEYSIKYLGKSTEEIIAAFESADSTMEERPEY